MSDLPTIAELVKDEDLLRRAAGTVLDPGPWEHKIIDDDGTMRCEKCRAQILMPLSYEETGEGLNADCPVPDSATGSIADISELLMKKLDHFSLRMAFERNSLSLRRHSHGGAIEFGWWVAFMSTPNECAALALGVLLPEKVKVQ